MRSERRRSCVTVSIVLVVAIFMATGQAVGGEDRGEEYFQNAQRYFEGRGVPQSDTEAVKWLRKAAEQGHAGGQNNLGFMYEHGRGVPQSDTEAVRWYREAAEQGNRMGQTNLGGMYFFGRGVPQSDTEAVRWTRKAAEQGDALGQNNLGVMYEHGRGVPQSDTEAVRWYRQAAEQGHANAQNVLRERGLTGTVRTPEQQEVPHVESPTPSSSPVGKQRAPASSRPAVKKQAPGSKIPDDLGDLD